MTYKNFQKQRLENASSDLRKDYALSALYCAGKCASVIGGVWAGFSALYDLASGNYSSAVAKGLVVFGASKGYKLVDKKMEEVSRRIGRNKTVLEGRIAEDYE